MVRHRMTDHLVIVLSIGALTALTPTGAAGQDLGQLYVEALDGAGQPVAELTTVDFTVTEDGVPGRIVSAVAGGAPMRIALLVGAGHQMNEVNATNPMRNGLNAFLDTLPPQHEVSLFSIARNIRRMVDFTTDRDELKEGAGLIFPEVGAGVDLLDGIKETWERRFEDVESFPVFVLVLADGIEGSGNFSDDAYSDLIYMLIQNGVTVHTVMLMTRGGSQISNIGENLSAVTGGLYENINTATGFPNVLTSFATRMGEHFDEVANRYRIVFERAPAPGGQISLQLNRPGITVRLFADRRMQ